MTISPPEAQLELALLDSKSMNFDRVDVFTKLINLGIPQEIVFRLEELWEETKTFGKKVIHVGRIVVLEIIQFIEDNHNLAIGVAIGAAVGALVGLIPYLGPLLAPLTTAIGAIFFGLAGSRLDRGHKNGQGTIGIAQDIIVLAEKFFKFLAAIFNALQESYG